MKKVIFTAVLLTAGVAFASAQTTETKNNDATTEKAAVAVDSAAADTTLKSEVVLEDNQVKMSDPNANQEQQADQEKKANEQPIDQAKKAEEE
ncbi:hypothetical protein [Chryseobacterium sp. T1]